MILQNIVVDAVDCFEGHDSYYWIFSDHSKSLSTTSSKVQKQLMMPSFLIQWIIFNG